jgi:hypothetical protein
VIVLKLLLEYKCYPLWIYNKNGEFVDNNFPEELESNIQIDKLLDEIQGEFDKLFIDNENIFEYIGFKSPFLKEVFGDKIKHVEKMIIDTLGTKGLLITKIDMEKL